MYLTPHVDTWHTPIQVGGEVFLMQKQSINSGIAQMAHVYFCCSFFPFLLAMTNTIAAGGGGN